MSDLNISGIQKLTLLDFPGKVACTLFTSGCNFRCPFCHNALLVTRCNEAISYDKKEILDFLKKRQGIIDGICISGGEPTLHHGLYNFVSTIKKMGYSVKLDTNGTNPDILKRLVGDGLLDYVAMDIKNSRKKYAQTCGLDKTFDLVKIEESIDFIMSGNIDFEFRTTVVNPLHTSEDFIDIGKWLSGNEKYYLQKFVDSGDLVGQGMSSYSDDDMVAFLNILKRLVPNAQLRGM